MEGINQLASTVSAEQVMAGMNDGDLSAWKHLDIGGVDVPYVKLASARVVLIPDKEAKRICTAAELKKLAKLKRRLFWCMQDDSAMIGICDHAELCDEPDGTRTLTLTYEDSSLFTAYFRFVAEQEFVISDKA